MLFRIFVSILTTFILASTNGQHLSFDEKVEQLYFNINISQRTPTLVEQFSRIPQLLHVKPDGFTIYRVSGKSLRHSFHFKANSFFLNKFDSGMIDIMIEEVHGQKAVSDIWWKLAFDKKENAIRVFNEMKRNFTDKNVISKIYKSEWAIETAEFTDTSAKKYPNIMFMLSDNKNLEKKFQIVFMLDNDIHNEE